eukprot:Gb_08384 [translate_table: standard]
MMRSMEGQQELFRESMHIEIDFLCAQLEEFNLRASELEKNNMDLKEEVQQYKMTLERQEDSMIMKLTTKDIEFSVLVSEMVQKYKVELGTLFSEIKNMKRREKETLSKEMVDKVSEMVSLHQELDGNIKVTLGEEVSKLQERRDTLLLELDGSHESSSRFQKGLVVAKEELLKRDEEIESLHRQLEGASSIEEKQRHLIKVQLAHSKILEELQCKHSEVEDLIRKMNLLEIENMGLKEKIDLQGREAEINRLIQEKEVISIELSRMESNNNELKERLARQHNTMQELTKQIVENLEARLFDLEGRVLPALPIDIAGEKKGKRGCGCIQLEIGGLQQKTDEGSFFHSSSNPSIAFHKQLYVPCSAAKMCGMNITSHRARGSIRAVE